ncbi:MAG: divergent polysaccharide deacetylase family protein [Methylobacterium frigidaeris]
MSRLPGRFARGRAALRPGPLLAAATGFAGLGLAAFVVLTGDPLGGEPFAVAVIERRAPEVLPPAPADRPGRGAGEGEPVSGGAARSPEGGTAPDAAVVRGPDPAPARLVAAPDPRVSERGRYGTLPRIGPNGSRALDLYARPEAPSLPGGAAPAGRIALLIAGLGIGQTATGDAVALPPAVTLAFTPYGPDIARAAARAREAGHEVMVQAPMEPFDYPDNDPGPQTLLAGARPADNIDRLGFVLGRVPGAVGVVNFMGARFTGDAAALEPVLREIGGRGLGYLDDGASPRSLALDVARRAGVPAAGADVVVDAVPRPDAIDRELARLEETARRKGFVLATATAQPLTLDRVARWARGLEARGLLLVPVSRALRNGR